MAKEPAADETTSDSRPIAIVDDTQQPGADVEESPPENLEDEGEEKDEKLASLADLSVAPIGRDAIMATKKDAGRIYQVKAFGGLVYFKPFTPTERDAFEAKLVVGKGRKAKVSTINIRAKMFVSRVVDQKGRRLFRDEDYALVGGLPGPEVEKVFQAMQEVMSISDEDIEELAGNSSAGRSDSSAQS